MNSFKATQHGPVPGVLDFLSSQRRLCRQCRQLCRPLASYVRDTRPPMSLLAFVGRQTQPPCGRQRTFTLTKEFFMLTGDSQVHPNHGPNPVRVDCLCLHCIHHWAEPVPVILDPSVTINDITGRSFVELSNDVFYFHSFNFLPGCNYTGITMTREPFTKYGK